MTSFRDRTGAVVTGSSQIGVQVGFQFVLQNRRFKFADFVHVRQVGRIDQRGAIFLDGGEHFRQHRIHGVVEAEVIACDADACAMQAFDIQKLCIVGMGLGLFRGRIIGIAARENAQQNGCVANGAPSDRRYPACAKSAPRPPG